MIGLRFKLLFGFGGLLLIVLVVSLLAQTVMEHYRQAIVKSNAEDYDSVAVCQRMIESVEQMDLAAQNSLWNRPMELSQVGRIRKQFEMRLATQRADATLPGEKPATEELAELWTRYQNLFPQVLNTDEAIERRREAYLTHLVPQSLKVRAASQRLIDMNLASILAVPQRAELSARRMHWIMWTLTASALLLAILFVGAIGRIVLRPVQMLTRSVHEIENGNLDLKVPVQSRDELGQLATAFNTMATRLKTYRQLANDRLVRTEQTTQLAIDSLPDAVLVINSDGVVELANQAARTILSIVPGDRTEQSSIQWLAESHNHLAKVGNSRELSDYESILPIEGGGEVRHFLPRTASIVDPAGRAIGTMVVLADVTGLRRLDEMKNSLLSLVSHELKTPLTSARMILHLVADQKVGTLNEKQADLLQAAREDTDRLHRIVDNLLDMSRIESGRALMELRPMEVEDLIRRSVEPLAGMFQGIALEVSVTPDLPMVWADATRIGHVVANLLMNSLRHTSAGGRVTVAASKHGNLVEISVSDTGEGIPRQHLQRVFEKFYRVPGQSGMSGSGLGLAIAKDVVEAHGGHIRIESAEGTGTTVGFTLRPVDASSVTPSDESGMESTPACESDAVIERHGV